MPENAIIETFLTLLAAVAVLGIILYFVKKYGNKINSDSNQIELKILAKMPIPPKNNLYVVRAGNKTLLIGASDKSISTLSELEDNSSNKKIKSTPKIDSKSIDSPIDDLSFANFLKSTLKKNN